MPMHDPDVIVIGSGPNGLVAGVRLAQGGLKVLVLEQNPKRPGGAVGSEELTRPGFCHDVGAAFFPMAQVSPAFSAIDLGRYGVNFCDFEIESTHPSRDGTSACIVRLDTPEAEAAAYFGSEPDTRRWTRIATQHRSMQKDLFRALFAPPPAIGAWLRLGPRRLLSVLSCLLPSSAGLSRRWFSSPAARRVLPALALHADVGPDDLLGGALGYVLGCAAGSVGYPVPRGGAQTVADALVTALEQAGGRLQLGARVQAIETRRGRASAVRLTGGDEIPARRAILADTSPGALLLGLLPEEEVPGWARRGARRFRHGWGTFKLDYALSGPVPWLEPRARKSATVHLGESPEALLGFTRQVRAGKLPEHPYLVVGQPSLVDPTRAPPGQATLYAYTHAPSTLEEGWELARERFADRVTGWIEDLAPGFSQLLLERRATAPPDLERQNPNLVGGDLGGGSAHFSQQLLFRPFFPAFRYRMPIAGLYLCSASTHPGTGVHGMCGYNAAERVLDDLRAR